MDGAASPAGLSEIAPVLLVQTDTTAGFACRDASRLQALKTRPGGKPFLKTYASLKAYKADGRIPTAFKREVRRSTKTTYVVRQRAFRIVSEGKYHRILSPLGWCYSTSANASGRRFDLCFAREKADIVIEDRRGLYEDAPSAIYRLNQRSKRRVR